MLAKDVVERRRVGTFRMAPLHGLLELSRIAQEDDALGRLRNSQDVCQGHLGGFVNKQNIHRFKSFLSRPKPSSSGIVVAVSNARFRGQVDDPATSRRIFPPRCACATACLIEEMG